MDEEVMAPIQVCLMLQWTFLQLGCTKTYILPPHTKVPQCIHFVPFLLYKFEPTAVENTAYKLFSNVHKEILTLKDIFPSVT